MHAPTIAGVLVGAMYLSSIACSESDGAATDTASGTQADTTIASDTGVAADTDAPPDTTIAIETAAATEASVADIEPGDAGAETEVVAAEVTEETCGCAGGSSCLQAKNADACVLLAATCTGGMQRVDACDVEEAEASCERDGTIHYHYWARIKGWLQGAKEACAESIGNPAGTFTVAAIPAGVGAPCACQRSAAACTQTYGDACATLTCEAPEGLQNTLCPSANRLAPRCVTRDGQRELVFYAPAATLENAELSCNGASVVAYYWFPDGL